MVLEPFIRAASKAHCDCLQSQAVLIWFES